MRVKLGEYIKIMHGYAFKTENYVDYGEYRLVTLGNFQEGGNCFKYNDTKATYYGADFPNKFILSEGDLILPLTEQVIGLFGNSAFVPKENRFQFVLNQRVGKVEIIKEGLDIYYLHYLLATSSVKHQLEARASGTKQRNISPDDVYDVIVDLPDYEIQKEIGKILYQIELKQENNNKIIAELESFAKTLYDYWFLQFEFPNEEGKPYKSSGGKMIYNKELKREIPEGWKVENVKSHCQITWGQCPDGENILPLNTDEESMLYCSGAGDMRNGLLVDCQARTNASRRTAKANDILMSVAGSIGTICYCDKTISLGRAAVAFSPKRNEELFTLMSVKSFSDRMKTVSSGSIQKVVNDNHLSDMNLVFDDEVLLKFTKYNYLLNKMVNLCKENQELASLRDFLLPTLMNGQVTFKED